MAVGTTRREWPGVAALGIKAGPDTEGGWVLLGIRRIAQETARFGSEGTEGASEKCTCDRVMLHLQVVDPGPLPKRGRTFAILGSTKVLRVLKKEASARRSTDRCSLDAFIKHSICLVYFNSVIIRQPWKTCWPSLGPQRDGAWALVSGPRNGFKRRARQEDPISLAKTLKD